MLETPSCWNGRFCQGASAVLARCALSLISVLRIFSEKIIMDSQYFVSRRLIQYSARAVGLCGSFLESRKF